MTHSQNKNTIDDDKLDSIIKKHSHATMNFIVSGYLTPELMSDLWEFYHDSLTTASQRDIENDEEICSIFETDLCERGYIPSDE